jgi:phosphate transport system substrate-binding protein
MIPEMRLIWCVALMALCSCGNRERILKIKGSDTEVNLSVALAEAYHQQHPETRLSVSGGGSGLGIAALMNGLADIANSSRPVSDEEIMLFRQKGIEIRSFVVAHDALAIITHSSMSIDSISVEELRALLSGSKKEWSPGLPVTVYGRQNNSGTYVYLKKKLGINFSLEAKEMNGNAQITEGVKADKGGIGYVGAGYAIHDGKPADSGYRILKVYENGQRASSPADYEAVVKGRYYFERPLYQYILASSFTKAKPLLDFEQSTEGQKIIRENGYYTE